jgi:hypothetical protein
MDESELPGGTYVFNQLVGDEVVTTTKENKYWLKPPYAPTYLENYKICRAAEKETE